MTDTQGSKFAHLLNPIRDLARNWNIDIAKELEEYLDDLESITITFHAGAKNLNFAEAALLIQGSTCVYSKKVEYLYGLVYQVLDALTDRNHKMNKNISLNADGSDMDAQFAAEPEFLPLDDVLEEEDDENIDLDEDGAADHDENPYPDHMLFRQAAPKFNSDESTMIGGASENGKREDFNMTTGMIHESGAVLLGERSAAVLDKDLQPVYEASVRLDEALANDSDVENEPFDDYNTDEPAAMAQMQEWQTTDDDQYNEQPLIYDDEPVPGDAQDMGQEEFTAGNRRGNRRAAEDAIHALIDEDMLADPWRTLDPHNPADGGYVAERPYRRGRVQKPLPLPTDVSNTNETTSFFKSVYFEEFKTLHDRVLKKSRQVNRQKRKARAPSRYAHASYDNDDDGYDNMPDANTYDDDDTPQHDDAPITWDDQPTPDDADFQPVEGDLFNHSVGDADFDMSHVQNYEDLCRQFLKTREVELQKYAEETELSKRVQTWQHRIEKVLAEEERHPGFDIHQYSDRLFSCAETIVKKEDHLEDPSEREIDFEELVEGESRMNICRNFVACLQLVNNGNLDLNGENDDGLRVRVLNHNIRRVDLGAYRAPSLREKETMATPPPTAGPKKKTKKVFEEEAHGDEEEPLTIPYEAENKAMAEAENPVKKVSAKGKAPEAETRRSSRRATRQPLHAVQV